MTEKIYIARHGNTISPATFYSFTSISLPSFAGYRLNWLNTVWTSPTGLARDPPLTAYGETQAEELCQYFLSFPEDERPTAIFSSPYYRCLQTSKPLAQALGLPIYVEHGIAEWYSPVAPGTGLHPRPGPTESLQTHFSEVDPGWSTIYYPTRKGESVEELHERVDAFVGAFMPMLEYRLPPERRRRLLFVTHAATTIALTRSFIGDRNLYLKVGCCSLTELHKQQNVEEKKVHGAWKPVALAHGEHLKGGSSREWGFEDIEIAKGKVVEDPGVPGSEVEEDHPIGLQLQRPAIQAISNL
ncbi:histidine phosphatase superfamily [Gymnopilus junonius]|uniref:Histidine phosphatase superfamily n=1 Tax=Gymnopilus junonius TaxID=109634 RepID=A0A9P5P2E7_GYMJU|nr:histidine phosphatase superfamily [Gymnopilus junonius]